MNEMQLSVVYKEVHVDNLQKIFSKYVPSELHEDFEKAKSDLNGKVTVNIHEFLQNLVDRSDNNFRMYGSGAELAENLAAFEDFPLSFNLFGFMDDYRATSVYQDPKYRNLKGQLYLTKREFVQQIQTSIREKYKLMETNPSFNMVQTMIDLEAINNNFYELFRYDRKVVDDINQRLFKVSTVDLKETHIMNQLPLYFLEFGFLKEQFRITKELYPISSDESDYYEYENLCDEHAQWFYPVSELDGFDMPAIVRIFEDGDQKFVMIHELFNNTIIKKPSDEKAEETGIWSTMDLNEVFRIFRDQVKDIEFIRCPIKRAKHAAVPVVAPDASHCILAADALLQCLRHLISGLQVFQQPSSELFYSYLSTLCSFFEPEYEGSRLFVKIAILDEMKNDADKLWSGKKAKQVKSIDNFDLKTLIREMKRIGLENTIPDICDYAEGAYQSVVENKKEPNLRTCDLIDAIEMCQLACIFNKYSKLKLFMHTQKACHQLPLVRCLLCVIKKAALEEKYSEAAISVPTTDSKSEQSKTPEDLSLKVKAPEQELKEKDSKIEKLEELKAQEDSSFRVEALQKLKEQDSKIDRLEQKVIEYEQGLKDAEKARVVAELDCMKAQKLVDKKEKQMLEMQKSKKEFEKLEKTVKKKNTEIDGLERKLKEIRRELEEQKANKEQREENEKLKEIIKKLRRENSEEIEKWKNLVKDKDNEIKKFTDENSKAQETVVSLRSSNEKRENIIRKLDANAKSELSKKDQMIKNLQNSTSQQSSNASVIKELQGTISTMAEHNEEQAKIVKSLLTRISSISLHVPSENSENLSIQKIKNLFNAPGPFELAKEMVEKLISLSNRPEIHQMARYELQQYQGKVENYLRELERKTGKISEFPSFSDRFMSEYWKEIDKNSQITLSDSECFICFSEMKFDEEQTLKCEHCRKIVHFECASKWLKIHRSCAHCRREMLDPDEFPSLR